MAELLRAYLEELEHSSASGVAGPIRRRRARPRGGVACGRLSCARCSSACGAGALSPTEAARRHRRRRRSSGSSSRRSTISARCASGFPEVVFGLGKTPAQLVAIARRLHRRHGVVLLTRVEPVRAAALRAEFPRAEIHERSARRGAAQARVARRGPRPRAGGVCRHRRPAGRRGGAGHRARARQPRGADRGRGRGRAAPPASRIAARLRGARVLVVVAGLEGALPSVVGGLVDRPLIAVPTSVGYGSHFSGPRAAARDAEFLRRRRDGGQRGQWIRGRLRRASHQYRRAARRD